MNVGERTSVKGSELHLFQVTLDDDIIVISRVTRVSQLRALPCQLADKPASKDER